MRERSWWLVVAAVFVAAWPAGLWGHGGQRVVPMLVEAEGGSGVLRVRYSFDVGLLLEGVSVDREWLAAQTLADLEEIAEDASLKLGEWFGFSVGGEKLEGVCAFPDLERLGDAEFDNGEPPGHVLVECDVRYGESGGGVMLVLAEDAPGTVVTKVVDGKVMRRPDVMLAGEEKEILVLAAREVEVEVGGEPAAVSEEQVMAELEAMEEALEPEADRWVLLVEGFWRAWDWRAGYALLAVALFLGCRGWRDVAAQYGGLVTGAIVAVMIGIGFEGVWTRWVFLGSVLALAVDAALGEEVRPWRVVAALGVGYVTGAVEMGAAGDWLEGTGELMPVALGPVAGVGVLVFLAFVVFGWGWGVDWFGRWVRKPVAWLSGALVLRLMV